MQKTEKYSSTNKNSSHNVECEKENETILNFITFFLPSAIEVSIQPKLFV
jgi:hypothetical protein